MIAPNPQVTYINHHHPSSNINHHQPTLLKHKNQQEKNHELQPRPHCQVCITRITMWSKCEQTNKNPLWLPVNVTFKCVQNRKEYRQADIRWQEHMWPVFSYKCVLSSWMGMHRVRYKLPGQLKSAFSPVTPPRQPQNGSRCESHKWAPGPWFPSFYHNLILASVRRYWDRRDMWK